MRKNKIFKVIISILLVISLSCNALLIYKVLINPEIPTTNNSSTNIQQVNYDVKSDLTDVIEQVSDSTVGVAVYQRNRLSGSGSGVVYQVDNKTVYVITNYHVIEDASSIEVVFENNETVKADLVGGDKYGDIALLKMVVDFDVKAIKCGDSDLLDRGEVVLAIGSPLGIEYAGTVTQGIVSATNRTISVDLNDDNQADWDMSVIQTDAAINPGNSGGAFVNAVGELVGITSSKYASTEVEGMGFAIPINDVINMIEEIKVNGKVTRPTLGISAVSLDGYSSYELYMYRIQTDLNKGIYISKVQSSSPAQKAGLQSGDVITKFNNKEIDTYKDFLTMLYNQKPGDKIRLEINRSGKTLSVDVTLGS